MRSRLLLLGLAALALAACDSSPSATPDGGACPAPAIQPANEPASTLDLAAPLDCSRARGGRLGPDAAEALVAGPQALSRAGDYKLYNCKVVFTIDGERVSDGYVNVAGTPSDADLVAPVTAPANGLRRSRGRDQLKELAPIAEVSIGEVVRVTLVNDGEDGQPAAVRAEGPAVALPFATWWLPIAGLPLWVTIDYRLAPGASSLEVTTTVRNLGPEAIEVPRGAAFQVSGTMAPWDPGRGFVGTHGGQRDFFGAVGDGIAYGLYAPGGLVLSLDVQGIAVTFLAGEHPTVAPCDTATWTFHWLVAEDVEGLQRARRALTGEAGGTALSGGVTRDGAPVVGARVHAFTRPGGAGVTATTTGAEGAFALELAPGDYTLYATSPATPLGSAARRAHGAPVEITVPPGAMTQDLTLPVEGTLEVLVDDGHGAAAAGKVQVKAVSPALPDPIEGLGERALPHDLAAFAFTADGVARLALPPGQYRVEASRGFFAEVHAEDVTIAAGATTTVAASLPETVDRTGWLAMDSHLHSDPSPDGACTLEERLLSIVAAGLDVAIETEHDVIGDYAPLVDAMGLRPLVAGMGGVEVSPGPIGHFNVYPITPRADQPNGGAPLYWEGFVPSQQFALLRQQHDGAVIQLNHPRSGALGYFDHMGFDPATGQPTRNEGDWSTDFNAMELANATEDMGKNTADYYAMLNLGVRMASVGTSDAHAMLDPAPGCSRSYVRTDAGRDGIAPAALAEAVRGLRTVATRGLMVEAHVGDAGPGDLVAAAAAQAAGLALRVQAPSWVNLTEVQIVANGVVVA
ncbi:MAG TPA: CehA/McbA family metallohydrolase, partial [Polyangia bacterium]